MWLLQGHLGVGRMNSSLVGPFAFSYGICTSCKGNKSAGLMPWNWRSCWKAKPALRNTSCWQVVGLNGAHKAPAPCDIWSVLTRPIASAHPAAPPPSAHTQHLTPRPKDKWSLTAINTKTGLKPVQTPCRVGGERRAWLKHWKWTPVNTVSRSQMWSYTKKKKSAKVIFQCCWSHHLPQHFAHWITHFVLLCFKTLFFILSSCTYLNILICLSVSSALCHSLILK